MFPVELITVYRRDPISDFLISVLGDLNVHHRQLIGSMEVSGTMFHGASGNEYGMRHIHIIVRLLRDSLNRNTIIVPQKLPRPHCQNKNNRYGEQSRATFGYRSEKKCIV
jgi:hypothetical protein